MYDMKSDIECLSSLGVLAEVKYDLAIISIQ